MSKKYVYLFTEGNDKMRELLGGKGANLAEMTNLGMYKTSIYVRLWKNDRKILVKKRQQFPHFA